MTKLEMDICIYQRKGRVNKMTARQAKREFINEVYGTDSKYRKARKNDYYKVQFEWTCFMDALCRDGVISQRTWDTATF